MTAEIRAFYAALAITLPDWADLNATVSCFAAPDAHHNADRHPSCSVSVINGAWKCHGCGARGGAYDAAIARGHTPRSAIDLMIACGLTEPRQPAYRSPDPQRSATIVSRRPSPPRSTPVRRPCQATETDVQRWAVRLEHDNALIHRLLRERAWAPTTINEFGLGHDGQRITIPIRTGHGQLRGVLRYDPFGAQHPKMLAIRGTQLGLIPHPLTKQHHQILLVEGPADMIAARSAGLPAIAVPGASAWRPEWAALLNGRHVLIVMDCDHPGRSAAEQIAADLQPVAAAVQVIDLDPARDDGYDLSDRIRDRSHTIRQRRGPRPIAWPLAVLLEHLSASPSTTRPRPTQEAHT